MICFGNYISCGSGTFLRRYKDGKKTYGFRQYKQYFCGCVFIKGVFFLSVR